MNNGQTSKGEDQPRDSEMQCPRSYEARDTVTGHLHGGEEQTSDEEEGSDHKKCAVGPSITDNSNSCIGGKVTSDTSS